MKRATLLLATLALAATVAAAELADGWQALADYQPAAAGKIFDELARAGAPAQVRPARFGAALALLIRQPVSDAQTKEARRQFAALAASGTDDVALGARFYLARIAQHHLSEPDNETAARNYRELIEAQPGSRWAQAALGRLAILEIYALAGDRSPAERIARAETLLAYARTPEALSDVHWVLANAIFHYRLPASRALPHLVAAERQGRLKTMVLADTYVQIAELSREAGNVAQAREFYRKLLKDFPRDQRHYLVQERLKALAAADRTKAKEGTE